MAAIDEWAIHTINLARSSRLSREEQDKLMSTFLTILHPDRYTQAGQLSLKELAGGMWRALDKAHKASIQQDNQHYAWNMANPAPWTFATPTPVTTPSHAGDQAGQDPPPSALC